MTSIGDLKPPPHPSLPRVPGEPIPPADPPKAKRWPRVIALIGAIFAILIIVVLVSTFFIEREIESRLNVILAKNLKSLPPTVQAQYSAVRVSLLSQAVRLLDIKVSTFTPEGLPAKTLEIDRVRVWGLDWETLAQIVQTRKAQLPHTISIAIDGLHLTPELLGTDGTATLQLLGYENLKLNLYAALDFNRERKTLAIENFEIGAPGVGALSGNIRLGNFVLPSSDEIARLKKDPRILVTEDNAFTKLTLNEFRVTYRDDSLVKRATESLTAAGEDTPESLVNLAIEVNEPTPGVIPARPVENDFTKPALEKLRAFFHSPSTITLTSHPPAPIPLMSVLDDNAGGSINELAHRLSLSVK